MRGFAQTVHCPRCGTARPTGAESVPIVTCTSCGLGFDPKPRAPALREALVATVPATLLHEQIADTDALLTARESVFSGFLLAMLGAALAYAGYLAAGVGAWLFLPVVAIASALAIYGGIGRMVNRLVVYVSADVLVAGLRPLPRQRERLVAGEVWSLTVAPRTSAGIGVTWDVVATEGAGGRRSVRLANVASELLARELVHAIRTQRARLGAPVLEPEPEA